MADSDTVIIELSRGMTTVIDKCDADLAEFNWCVAGRADTAARKLDGKHEYLHRVILARMTSLNIKGKHAVHINGDKRDNRRANLRLFARPDKVKTKKVHVCPYAGIYWVNFARHWEASIVVDSKIIYIGLYDTPEQAHAARCEFIQQL